MSEHTKEPWPQPEYDNDDCSSFQWWEIPGVGRIYSKEDASRIVACVNACEGVPTDDLVALKRPGDLSWVAAFSQTIKQRDELAAALTEYVKADLDDVCLNPRKRMALESLTKVGAGRTATPNV